MSTGKSNLKTHYGHTVSWSEKILHNRKECDYSCEIIRTLLCL